MSISGQKKEGEKTMSSMYEDWMRKAFTQDGRSVDAVWKDYMPKEQKIYEHIAGNPLKKL